MADFLDDVKTWFEDLADWVQENLGDPAIAAALRDDLGLAPGEDIPAAQRNQIQQLGSGFDPDKKAFLETVEEIKGLVEVLIQLGDQIGSDEVSGWDAAYLMGKVSASESMRLHVPLLYALGKLTLFISDDPDRVSDFDPAVLVALVRGEPAALGTGEQFLQRLTAGISLLTLLLEALLEAVLGSDFLDAYYGWDPAPDSATPNADLVSARAMTFLMRSRGDVAGQVAMTAIAVPPEHGGPALLLSLGGGIAAEHEEGGVTYKFEAGVAGALDLWIPFSSTAYPFAANGDLNGYLKLSALRQRTTEPAIRIGDAGKTRLEIGSIGFGVDLMAQAAGFRVYLKDGELVIKLGEGDGFLQQLPVGEIKLGFNLSIAVDTQGGLRVEGGTLLRAMIPVEASVGGFLNIHHVDLILGPGRTASGGSPGYDIALEMSTAFGLNLGPFRASVDRLGFEFQFAFREGNLGFMDGELGFKPPNGVGMVLDAGIVKGGGYLFFDHSRGEYSGALELKFASWGLKAIGILSTRMPDGSPGFALLLLIYADLPRFHIAFGIFFEGVGGIIGLQHGVSLAALQESIPTGALDDILFPANPVADAPRIINRLRVIFPIRQYAFLVGPMFRLTWGTPAIGEIKLGLLLAMDNVLGGDRTLSLSSIVLLGQLRIGMPETQTGSIVRIICDFLGYLDFDNQRFGFYARLRNSRLVEILELTGSLVLQIDFGDNPAFVVAVGGFHPRFRDLPAGLPSKLDRVGLRFDIAIVKITIQCYLAVTSATIQFGAEVRLKVELGPLLIEGWLGFDALIYYQPRFRFEIDFRVGMVIKVFGQTLMGITVEGMLAGPGRWQVSGKVKFSILFWDFEESFDEQWGDEPVLPAASTDVAALMAAAYSNTDNWSAQLPAGTDALVTLSALPGETDVLAHPLGQLRVTQKIAPLGLTLEKYGETQVQGANRFDLEQVTIGDTVVANPSRTREHLARAAYLNLTEEQRLTQPSFETFDVGVAVGTTDYVTPAAVSGDLSYETRYLEPGMGEADGVLIIASLSVKHLLATLLTVQASQGAAAQAQLRINDSLRPATLSKLSLAEPALAIVNTTTLATVVAVADASNQTLVRQQFAVAAPAAAQVVEAFELS